MIGECGKRGGYFETSGIDAGVLAEIYKLLSVSLCSNVLGQLTVGLMVNPPRPGDPSFPLYNTEVKGDPDRAHPLLPFVTTLFCRHLRVPEAARATRGVHAEFVGRRQVPAQRGRHVLLPADHAAQGRRQRGAAGVAGPRPLLLPGAARQHRHLRGAWLRCSRAACARKSTGSHSPRTHTGFGQRDGTFHFRTTFLPQENQLDPVMDRMASFHATFLKKYQ